MAMRKSVAARNVELNALAPEMNNGYIRVYQGTLPTNPETAVNGTLLAELRFNATAFAAASGGVITANGISGVSISVSGTAGYFRCLKSDGTTAVYDGEVATAGKEMTVPTVTFTAGVTLNITALTITNPM